MTTRFRVIGSDWPDRARKGSLAGPIGLAIIISLAKIVITLLKSFENPPPYPYTSKALGFNTSNYFSKWPAIISN